MSWHFLQEREAESWVDGFLAGLRSARSKSNRMHAKSYCRDKETECLPNFRFGTMCAPLTEIHGEVLSTSSAAAFPAKTSAQPDEVQALRAKEAVYGKKCSESFARFDHATRSWRTAQCSLLGDLEPYSEVWPKAGIMLRGWCWEPTRSEHLISGSGCGFSRRTPDGVSFFHTPNCSGLDGGSNSRKALKKRHRHLFPTPTCAQAPNSGSNTKGPKSLMEVSKTNWSPGAPWPVETLPLRGGQLNPMWVEWLMGWPLGWTDLKPLAMDRFHSWQQQHFVN